MKYSYDQHYFLFFRDLKLSDIKNEESLFSLAEKYIQESNDFNKKDDLETAGILAGVEANGLIEFIGYNRNIEKYKLTTKGLEEIRK